MEKSDLVVIARATKTESNSEKWTGENPPNNVSFVAVETSFKIELIIKQPAPGEAKDKLTTVKLVHFKDQIIDPSRMTLVANGHSFVKFRTNPVLVQINKPEGGYGMTYDPEYLLYFCIAAPMGILSRLPDSMTLPTACGRSLGPTGEFLSNLKTK